VRTALLALVLLRASAWGAEPRIVAVDAVGMTVADMDASIDFLCLPNFDSPSVFAALVDAERGGRFQIAPLLGSAARKQLYLPDTNVLLTRFLDASGVAEVSDFMPVEDAGQAHNLVRRAKTVRGEVRFEMRCDPRFDYARAPHTAERRSDTEVLFVGPSGDGELVLRLRSSVPMRNIRRSRSPALTSWMPCARLRVSPKTLRS